jgi:amino acid adenylation domain-containing protein
MVMAPVRDPEIEDRYSLSPLQQGMLFHTLREKGVGMYISQAVSRYEDLDVTAFRQAWQLVVERHAVLRTSFHWEDPEAPYQKVHRKVFVPFHEEDWRGQSPSEQQTRLRKLQQREREQGFDLGKPCQLRVTVIRITRTRWFCLNSHHHIILDGWSGAVLAGELQKAYFSFRRGTAPSFDPAVPFGRYIRWIESRDTASAQQFWEDHLAPVTRPTPLPAAREPGAKARVRTHAEVWEVTLDPAESDQVARFAAACRVTLNTVIQSAWPLVLSRYSGEKSVLFGVLVSGRPPEVEGVESIVGMFLNTIPFCVTVEDGLAVKDWLRQVQDRRTALQQYEFSSLMMVRQWSRIPGGMPLFDSIVARKDVTQAAAGSRRSSRGKAGESRSEQSAFQQNYPILLNITASKGIELKITYDPRRFRAIDISRVMDQLRHVLTALSRDPDRKLGEIGPGSVEELMLVRNQWNDTGLEVPDIVPLPDLLARLARTCPDRTAVKTADRKAVCFQDLDRLADRAARYLAQTGVTPGAMTAVALTDPVHHLAAVLGAMRAGARCLPLDGTPEDLAGTLARFTSGVSGDGAGRADSGAGDAAVRNAAFPDDTGLILRNAAGAPAPVSHWMIGSRFAGTAVAFAPDTCLGTWFSKDSVAFFSEVYACWQQQGCVAFMDPAAVTDPAGFCRAAAQAAVTRVSVTPTLLAAIVDDPDLTALAAGITTWLCAGEPVWPELGEAFNTCFPEARLVHVLGFSSLGPCLAWEVPKGGLAAEGVRLGRPLPNVRAYVATDSSQPAPVGVPGRLVLAVDGTGAGSGPDRAEPGGDVHTLPAAKPLMDTGVRARYWNDGTLEYLDPAAHPFRLQLERLLRKTARTPHAAVVTIDSDMRLACIHTPGPDPDLPGIHRRVCRTVPPEFAPTHYLPVTAWPVDRFGRTGRAALAAMQDRAVDAAGFVQRIKQPVSEIEKIIADVWMEVLKLDKISTDDNFFEIGGHSLAATKATARLTRILQSDIQLKGIFEAPTVSGFARWIQSDRHKEELPFAIEAADRGRDAPLTFTQHQLWVLGQLFPQLPTYTIPSNAVFTGKMDVDALKQALADVVDRHEILRTVFVFHNGEPRQIVRPALPDLHLDRVDVSHLPENERMEKARWHGAQLGKQAWDFENGPLIRPQLVKLGEHDYLLNTAFHHIIADGPSMGVYIADLGACYTARCKGRSPKLPRLPLQFADFAVWERENVKGALFDRQLDYWRKNLDGAALLEIPTDFPRPPVHGFFGKKVKFEIPPETGSRLYRLGRDRGATMFMTLLAVYQLLLHKYSGQDDIVIGSAMTNRIRVELEKLIGLFVNTVPLRTDFSGDPTFREVIERVRDCCLGAYANMDLPFEETIAQIQPHRDLSRQGSPLFQFMLIHNPGGRGRQNPDRGAGPAFRPGDPHNDTGHANFDLLLSTRDTADGLIKITMAYDTELFRQETIDRMIVHLHNLVTWVTDHPDRPVSGADLSGDAERAEILTAWNGEDAGPVTRTVHQRILDHARKDPDHPAVRHNGHTLTYGGLEEQTRRVAARLTAAGTGAESMVAVCLPRGIDLIVGIVGILRAGGAFVPIDAGYPAERIRYILEQTGAVHLVSTPDLAPAVLAHKPDLVLMDIHGACAGPLPPDLPPDPAGLNDLAYVIFTSGSTGLPKGVMVEHRSLAGIIRSQVKMFEITRHSRVLQMLSISFDAAVGEIFRTLTAGGTLYMADPDDLLPGPALVNLLKENRITAVAMSPTALGAMPDCSEDLPDLATITVGGEACPRTVAERWGKGRRLLNAYGPTETTIGATLAVNWDLSGKPPLGRPLPGVKVYVLDRQGHIAPVGTPGELYIGGIGVTRGYLNRPELTEKSFVPDPFSDVPGARMYRTGDLVRWLSTGMLDFLGRIDLQVKIRGFRIELGEIETALGKHPDIDHCTVNVYETGGVKRLIAYLVPRPGTDPSGLRTFLKQKLPEYMIPAFFMTVDKIPTTSSGKVDRNALPAPESGDLAAGPRDTTPPETGLEKHLADLWTDVLGLKTVGVLDNFFEIGGDSISAIRLAARAAPLGITFTPRDMFVNQTIRELADFLDSAGTASPA